MYSYFKGILTEKEEGLCVVETGGVGYNILVGGAVLERLPAAGNEVKLYTYTSVREDALQLFGFLTKEDVRLFRLLIGVSGIGPKGAQAILSQ
ncbi:MAG: Holliday junction branch migration protein RuvA, partial [Lachnospiraceae bacterium]|nr:Holliday junction branch migration protein RuvA [Lachnospiraceae bacterium]